MFSSVRRHLSYANVVATMALVFAMGGSAMAAKHYLVSSTSQISPQVLKALEVKIASRIAPGAPGKEGAAGKEGARGQEGPAGPTGTGKEGPEGKSGGGISKLSESEQEKLKTILPYIDLVASGVDGKPTIQFTDANVQVISGAGKESTLNGEGNLVVGYNENPRAQSGSNNLVIGSSEQEYGSYGAVLGGAHNAAAGPYSDVFGTSDKVTGQGASVSGGHENTAEGEWSSIGGGYGNTSANAGIGSSISGGDKNEALVEEASIGGGYENKAEGEGAYSSIFGGKDLLATKEYEALP